MSKNKHLTWQFEGPLQRLEQRAFLLSEIRQFFHIRKVLEVETPVLSRFGNTDLQIDMFSAQPLVPEQQASFLRTSPEFFHKRLLANGSGDVFEIAKVFRRGERSRLHNPEFTLLEWYRLSFDWHDLAAEVVDLINHLLIKMKSERLPVKYFTYRDLFVQCTQLDPFEISLEQLKKQCAEHGYSGSDLTRTEALDYIFALIIQPQLSDPAAFPPGLIIHDFPIEMAALAQVHPEHPDRCLRFEFLWLGTELANGYQELTDAVEQERRFNRDNQLRQASGKPQLPLDEHLLAALAHGLPPCSGVAMGVERLLMCLLGCDHINQVMGFHAGNS